MSKNPGKYWSKNGPNTSAALAQLLDAEGFSDHCANQVEGYWRRSSASKDMDHIQMLREGVGALSKKLTEAEKKILGRFVSLHMRMGFDTGLRMGLAVRFVREPEGSYTPAAQRAAHGPREDLALDTGERDGGVGSVATPSNVGHDGVTRSHPAPPKAQHPSGDVERVVRALEFARETMRDVLWAAVNVVGYGSQDHRCRFCDCRAPDLVQMNHAADCVIHKVRDGIAAIRDCTPAAAPEPGR